MSEEKVDSKIQRIKELQVEFQQAEQKFGGRSSESLSIMHRLAIAYWEAKLYDESKVVLQEAYEQRKALLGDSHLDTLTSMKYLATLLHKLGQRKEAWYKLEVCHSKCKADLGEDHPLTAEVSLMLSTYSRGSGGDGKDREKDTINKKPMSKKMFIKLVLLGLMLLVIGYMLVLRLSKSMEKPT
ncbi:tetratricopeptide repeat protein [archaeon]|nr:MAG: tetratricopeptide repeat protein [archaeon]